MYAFSVYPPGLARQPRLHIPGGLYHVMLQGNGGQPIFFADADRQYFEHLVAEGITRFGHRIHGSCSMTNHVHVAIQSSKAIEAFCGPHNRPVRATTCEINQPQAWVTT